MASVDRTHERVPRLGDPLRRVGVDATPIGRGVVGAVELLELGFGPGADQDPDEAALAGDGPRGINAEAKSLAERAQVLAPGGHEVVEVSVGYEVVAQLERGRGHRSV